MRQLPATMDDGSAWPLISVITPSLNQGDYIEETIRSVLGQGYPNLEYIVIDGGSADQTVDVLQKYARYFDYWVSEPDKGQAQALNKGFAKAGGELYAYINSDDYYTKDALKQAAEAYVKKGRPELIVGVCEVFDETGVRRLFKPFWPDEPDYFLLPFGSPFAQPASFWRADMHHAVGGFEESLHYVFDREFFLKMALRGTKPVLLDDVVVRYRDHASAKTRDTAKVYRESVPVLRKYGKLCGFSEKDLVRRVESCENDAAYHDNFDIWRRFGRFDAGLFFLKRSLRRPRYLADRKVLGLARRLLMFRESDVAELADKK